MTDKITKANLAKYLVGALRLTPEELEDMPAELLAELRPRRKPKRRKLTEKDLTEGLEDVLDMRDSIKGN